jgi:hypothetical protein
MGPILDMIAVTHEVVGTLWEELGWRVNTCLLCLYVPDALPPRSPLREPMSSRTTSYCLLASFPMAEKKEIDK